MFHRRNGKYPQRILIFRDGISEGQYAAYLGYEHNAVITACSRLQAGYRPLLLICVCAKRHNTRFFGQDRDVDRSGNLPSGLVVDRTVTHPYAFDFFLQAHAGRVGTARPTHYICLLDEIAMTPDMMQQLVNSLCYSFSRCTSSVSVVPVCYIAGASSVLAVWLTRQIWSVRRPESWFTTRPQTRRRILSPRQASQAAAPRPSRPL